MVERLLNSFSEIPHSQEILRRIENLGFFGQTARRDANGFFVNVPGQTSKPENDFIIARRRVQSFDEAVPSELGSQIFGVRFVEYGTNRIFLELMRGITNERGSELLFSAGIVGRSKQENLFDAFFQRPIVGEEVKELIGETGMGRQIKTFATRGGVVVFLDDFCLFLNELAEKQQMALPRAIQIKEVIDGIKRVGILKDPETIVTASHMRVDLETETVWARDQVSLKEYNLSSLASTPAQVEQTKKLIRQLISGAKCAHESGKEEACFYAPLPSVNGMSAVSSGKIPVNEFIFDSRGNVRTVIIYAPPSHISIQEYERVLNEILLTVGWRINPRPTEFSYTDDGPMPADKLAQAIVQVLDKYGIGDTAYRQKMLQQAAPTDVKQHPIDRQLPIAPVERIYLVDLRVILPPTLFTESTLVSLPDAVLSVDSVIFSQTALIHETKYETDGTYNEVVFTETERMAEQNITNFIFEEEKSNPVPTGSPAHLELPKEESQNSMSGEEMKRHEKHYEVAQRTRVEFKEASRTIRAKTTDVQRQEKTGRAIKERIIEREENVLVAMVGRSNYRRKRNDDRHINTETHRKDLKNRQLSHIINGKDLYADSLANKPTDIQTLAEDANRRVCEDKEKYGYKNVILMNDSVSVQEDEFPQKSPQVSFFQEKCYHDLDHDNSRGEKQADVQKAVSESVGKADVVVERHPRKVEQNNDREYLRIPLLNLVSPPKIIFSGYVGEQIENLQKIQARKIWETFLRIYFGIRANVEPNDFIKTTDSKTIVAIQEIAKKKNAGQFWSMVQYTQLLGILLICVINFMV